MCGGSGPGPLREVLSRILGQTQQREWRWWEGWYLDKYINSRMRIWASGVLRFSIRWQVDVLLLEVSCVSPRYSLVSWPHLGDGLQPGQESSPPLVVFVNVCSSLLLWRMACPSIKWREWYCHAQSVLYSSEANLHSERAPSLTSTLPSLGCLYASYPSLKNKYLFFSPSLRIF